MLKPISVLAMLVVAVPVAAEPPTIFGQPLGKPIAYPECRHAKSGAPAILGYATDQLAICFKRTDKPDQFLVEFPEQYAPEMLGEGTMAVITLDGNVEEIQLNTLGDWRQVLKVFGEKFGPRAFISDEQVMIAGDSAPKQFRWQEPDFGAIYQPLDIDPRFGLLYVSTPKADAAFQQSLNGKAQGKVKF